MSAKEKLIEHLEEFGDTLQTLAFELEDDDVNPMMVVSMQIQGEREYQKLERLMDEFLKESEETA